jgi:hypothetical protein
MPPPTITATKMASGTPQSKIAASGESELEFDRHLGHQMSFETAA